MNTNKIISIVGILILVLSLIIVGSGHHLSVAIVSNDGPANDKFELIADLGIVTVPANYNSDTHLFRKERGGDFFLFDPSVTDANFAHVTDKLTPGQRLRVKVLRIKQLATPEECLARLQKENARLVGAQGLLIVFDQKRDELPKGYWYISLDEKSALPSIYGLHRVPYVSADAGGGFGWDIGSFGSGWGGNGCLLCFCDLPA